MKTIVFVRHGKSSWDYEVSDKDRPLQERGIRDALLVSETYKRTGTSIDKVYASPANRALHTCMIFTRNWDFPLERVILSEALYDFSGDRVASFVLNLDDSINTIALFGHNYAFTELVNSWGSKVIENVPTSGLVELTFDISRWSQLEMGRTTKILFPKQLRK